MRGPTRSPGFDEGYLLDLLERALALGLDCTCQVVLRQPRVF